MNDEEMNMSMRKFLKQVGVTSQQQIEQAIRASGKSSGSVKLKAVITSDDIDLTHEINGEIHLGD